MLVNIEVPYYSQHDNEIDPGATCNVTSLSMAISYYKASKLVTGPHKRIADNISQYCLDHHLNHGDLTVIANLARHYGLIDDASFTTSFDQIKAHLDRNNLVIVQGNFTASGHVIVVVGYDDKRGLWYCNDPAGHWPDYSGNTSGKGVAYDSKFFRAKAAPDGEVWAHRLNRPVAQ